VPPSEEPELDDVAKFGGATKLELAGHAPHTKDISFLPTTILLFVISLALPSLWHGSLDRKVSAMAMTVTIATHLWSLTSWMPERICVFQWETEALVLAVSVILPATDLGPAKSYPRIEGWI
jgi:hypothetical protein